MKSPSPTLVGAAGLLGATLALGALPAMAESALPPSPNPPISEEILHRAWGRFEASMPHPRGAIAVSYRRDGAGLEARVTLPPGLPGEFVWRGLTRTLGPGEQSFRME